MVDWGRISIRRARDKFPHIHLVCYSKTSVVLLGYIITLPLLDGDMMMLMILTPRIDDCLWEIWGNVLLCHPVVGVVCV